ncbi:diguanylate cyclase/phosphodiesterase (GGDEF & EAL domains) with PAS/PAC sensor(s) [hydrothermal vent metagenome]|uniref:Diguanylate cyclase/phosphodiesterase (GGDEF & EAL domains) with PAS/PAC sensor(S) n=1 Tax=hydrothermal vent metagenome TaxID=652676 RepID=A0A3B0ZI69_9ZZZZ
MIALAQDMGLTVIAEGVEDKAQLQFLKSCGCDLVQGFYFSEALPNNDFIHYVEHTL